MTALVLTGRKLPARHPSSPSRHKKMCSTILQYGRHLRTGLRVRGETRVATLGMRQKEGQQLVQSGPAQHNLHWTSHHQHWRMPPPLHRHHSRQRCCQRCCQPRKRSGDRRKEPQKSRRGRGSQEIEKQQQLCQDQHQYPKLLQHLLLKDLECGQVRSVRP